MSMIWEVGGARACQPEPAQGYGVLGGHGCANKSAILCSHLSAKSTATQLQNSRLCSAALSAVLLLHRCTCEAEQFCSDGLLCWPDVFCVTKCEKEPRELSTTISVGLDVLTIWKIFFITYFTDSLFPFCLSVEFFHSATPTPVSFTFIILFFGNVYTINFNFINVLKRSISV